MIKTKLRGIFILLVMLCITFAFAIGCESIDMPNGTGGGNGPKPKPETAQLPAVAASSVQFSETSRTLVVTWDAVPNATSYTLRITKGTSTTAFMTTVEEPYVDLRNLTAFTVPDNGTITIRFTAKASDCIDSEITEITYELEGTLLLSPEITSFDNGIIEWKKDPAASSYTVKVNGTASETQTNTYNVSGLTADATIEISAKIGGKTGAVTKIKYDATAQKLSVLPIIDYKLDGDMLRWEEIGGAIGYKIVDLDFNSYTVTTPYYIMSTRNIVYGVYPVMSAASVVESAEVVSVDINYLGGKGTQAEPYLIKTPFDLRTIDYYELKATEAGGATNYYKIANDLDYSTVSALEANSNMFTLRKPFMGVLDGDNHTLSNISVNHNNGFWALFEFIATGATVGNVKFDYVEINNDVQKEEFPINPATAMVAYRNYGTVSAVTLSNARLTVTAGGAAGLVIHNYGKVTGCTVNKCELKEASTNTIGTALFEMGGVVLENCAGGEVSGNTVTSLTVTGTTNKNGANNVGSAAGIVSINRKGATVSNNSYDNVTINNNVGKEVGGVVAYCAKGGTVTKGTGTLGTLTVNRSTITKDNGTGSGASARGKLCGKNDN